MVREAYDVVVVGGGAAGLSAGVVLARARRSVLVVDAGEPRNAPAEGVHGLLGQEGVGPAELLARGRAEVRSYGGEVVDGRALAVQQQEEGFLVVLEGSSVRCRRVVVATGLRDGLPDVPGVAEQWGRGVVHCPYCHGWEVRDRRVGVLATGPLSVHQALLFRQWTDDVVLLLHAGGVEPSDEEWEQLAARGVEVVDGEVAALESEDGRVRGARLASGVTVPLDALAVATRMESRAGVLAGLGLEAEDLVVGGARVGAAVPAGAGGETAVPGVYVAGNVTDLRAQVVVAAAAGLTVGALVNADLVGEDTRRAVEARRAALAGGTPRPFGAAAERELAERVLGDRRHGVRA
nr:NAD(P)/FAD-dependent oxidoreductase [Vallicoccus soli]